MASHRSRVTKLEERTHEDGFLVIIRRDGETDEDAWAGYLQRRGLPSGAPAPVGRVIFISEVDSLA